MIPPAEAVGLRAQGSRGRSGLASGKGLEEGIDLRRPPSPDLKCKHLQLAPGGAPELRVGGLALARSCRAETGARSCVSRRVGHASPRQGADEGDVHGNLGASKGRKAMRDDLQPAGVSEGRAEVEVPQHDIGSHSPTGFATDRRCRALQRPGPPHQRACSGAGGPVVPEGVKRAAARASPGGCRERQSEAAQQDGTEEVIGQPAGKAGREARQDGSAAGASLGQEQSPRCKVKVRKEHLEGVLVQGGAGSLLPATDRVPKRRRGVGPHAADQGSPGGGRAECGPPALGVAGG